MGMHLAMTARDPRAAFLSDAAILASLREAPAATSRGAPHALVRALSRRPREGADRAPAL